MQISILSRLIICDKIKYTWICFHQLFRVPDNILGTE